MPFFAVLLCTNVLLNVCFQICYGLTETSPVTNQTLMDDPIDLRVSTIGRVHPNNEVPTYYFCSTLKVLIGNVDAN